MEMISTMEMMGLRRLRLRTKQERTIYSSLLEYISRKTRLISLILNS